ncbi:MAG TPA: MotA/TolQ/ExbB proton channel family protein [Candidatus Polarisedimenticolaceae bacterium]|nr:MotA/TolQ/ExbB proton channel family protein [Candidatus Polarisedimenticolaceae bacterium]
MLILAAAPSRLDVWALVMESGAMAKFVLLVLLIFSVVSWGIIWERWRAFKRAQLETDRFLDKFKRGGGLAAIQDGTAAMSASPLAHLFRAAFREISLNPPPAEGADPTTIEALDRVLRKNASVQVTELERSLGFLATTAGATPFIGLFGTVWGIMNAFHSIGAAGTASLAAYAPGIAEALVATAAGLFAAIPALIGYNHFMRKLRLFEAGMDEFSADMVHRVLGRRS